jgi:eukaryotic-like serine/threonine-protein kinase
VNEPEAKTPAAATLGDGRYIIGRELGRGTMGVVYEAEDTLLARTVAVKTIELAFAAAEPVRNEFERRFFTEARVAARLSHPGIVVCHDVGKDPATAKLFIVFECLKGRTLAERAVEGPMAWRDALAIVVQVARAIHHAHEHGVVHRDLKPANIMLLDPRTSPASAARGGTTVKIMDFGVARLESLGPRLTKTGQSFGSPLYTSPEQALGEASSARSDIFSLGSVLCTLLLGRPWFDAPSLPEIVARVVHDDAPRVSSLRTDVPAALDGVVAAALAKREDDRYATAADMADDLEDVLAGRTPTHAGAVARSLAPGRASAEDALLDGLVAPADGAGRAVAADPSDALASLLDESTVSAAAGALGTATEPIGPVATTTSPGASATRMRWARRGLAAAGAVMLVALVAAGALLWRPRPAAEPTPPPDRPIPSAEAPAASVLPAPQTITPAVPATVAREVVPSAPPATVENAPASPAPPASLPPAPAARPRDRAAAGPVAAVIESPATQAAATGEAASAPSPVQASATRMKLNVEHPFENGRLIVWVDGVLVFEAKLQAPVSKRIVGVKVREGRVDKMFDVDPGPHEVRVEVTWDQERRLGTKLVDVAPGSTGLLEVRISRLGKDLNLEWSRLAKD